MYRSCPSNCLLTLKQLIPSFLLLPYKPTNLKLLQLYPLFCIPMQLKFSNLLTVTGLAAAAEQGWTGVLNIKTDAGLGGTVTVVNDTAVMITGYTPKSATAPALHWWGSTAEDISKGFRVNSMRVSTATPDPTTIMVLLDSGKTASDFTYFGLWCESLSANFGRPSCRRAAVPLLLEQPRQVPVPLPQQRALPLVSSPAAAP